eukprot:gb/GECH01012675.1/.p1 GENE.gb/GECH01012675.1/~~gb/GECH01012675.1/.p1  ORF type:complete len:233 (+),score=13.90 gb/GECH01012675.1/:1-699(+)
MKLNLTITYIVPFEYLGIVASTSENETTYPLGCPILIFLRHMGIVAPHTEAQDIEIMRKGWNKTVDPNAPLFVLQTDSFIHINGKTVIEVDFRYRRFFHEPWLFGLFCSVKEDKELSLTQGGLAPVVLPTLTVCYQLRKKIVIFLNHYPPLVLEDNVAILSDVMSRLLGNKVKISCSEDLRKLSNVAEFSANGTRFRVNFIVKQNNMKKQNMVYLSSSNRQNLKNTGVYTLL